jgi:hypothetical protein
MTKISGSSANAYWYDPSADSATLIGTYATMGIRTFASPGTARVLVIDDASKGYTAPASVDAVFAQLPLPVAGVSGSKISGWARLSWVSQNPPTGVATGYDVVTGSLADLRAVAGYAFSTCLVNNVANTPYDDPRHNPIPGQAYFYVIRASGPNGPGTYGSAALDAASPCP